jgi:hypothetical protein
MPPLKARGNAGMKDYGTQPPLISASIDAFNYEK